ncbi:MAG: T9SS type A sorting domain-containing protein [Ferruginibacter sp.]
MKKNYIAVFHQAENLIKKITLIILIVLSTLKNTNAQSSRLHSNNQPVFSSQKGPFDITEQENVFDASPPVITYTPLTSTCSLGSRSLAVTITDADGIPTGIGSPRLYWQVNSGATQFASPSSVVGNVYTFSFGLGATAGSLVSYYIVAQDNVGNVIAKPSAGAGGYTTNPPAAAIDPTTPDFYVVQSTLVAGTYTVGAGGAQNYLTITDAVNAYNNSCLSGAVTFLLMDPAYDASEVFPITINNPLASSANTLTIKPNTGVNPIIQGSASDAIFKLSGADYITIDGSNTAAGTTRNLSIINTSSNLASVVVWLGSFSASNGATHNTIKNCTISGSGANTTYAGIVTSSGVIAGNLAEAANSDNTFLNNVVNTSYYGILVIGPAAGESNNVISSNTVGSSLSAKKLGYRGVYICNETNVQVIGNTISGIISSIGIGSDIEPTAGIVVSGAISGGTIASNFVNSISNTSVGGWPSYGISLQSTSPAAGIKVFNNMIYGAVAYGNNSVAGNNGIGIAMIAGGGYGIYFNSIHLLINQGSPGGGISSCIFIGPGITGTGSVDVRNNIFSDRRTSGTCYAIYCSQPNIVFSNINYNDYYSTSFLGFLGANRANIGAWQAATLLDGNSVAVNPVFLVPTSPGTDLHLNLISPLNDQGQAISGITTDIDGTTRSVTVPDIGADEITPPPCSGNSGGTAVSDFITVCSSGSVSLSASGFSYGLGIAYQWEYSQTSAAGPWSPVGTETNPTSANPPSISVTTWYRLRVICAAGSPGYSNVIQVTVYNPSVLTTTPGSRCGPGNVTIGATGTAGTAIQWYTAPTGGIPLYTGNPFTTPSPISVTTPYYAESTFLGSSGTVGLLNPSGATGISTQLISWQVYFNVIQATKLLTIDIYPLVTGENFTLDVYNSTGTVIASRFFTTLVSGGATAQTLDLGVSLPIGNGYYLYATNGIPPTGLTRNLSGVTYPYNSTDIVITGNEFSPSYYMCYYNWRFTNGCSSPRTLVNATVGLSATVNATATPASICAGNSTVLNATSSNTGFVYTWYPPLPTGLVGATQTYIPATTTTYTVNATDGTCTGTNTVTVTVNPASTPVSITPATVTKCASAPGQWLTATGGDISGAIIVGQDFNAGTPGTSSNPAGGWTIANTSTGGTPLNAAWTYRPDFYVYSTYTMRSNDSSIFFLTNSAAQGSANGIKTRTVLQSPAFSLAGYTSISLYFYHCFVAWGSPVDSVAVEYSSDNTTWTNLRSFPNSRGNTIKFRKDTISLNAYLGAPTNYIRFRYYGSQSSTLGYAFFWAIDNISVVGTNVGSTPITWAPTTGLYTNAAATPPFQYAGGPTTTVFASPTVTTTYTATATPVNACERTQTMDFIINSVTPVLGASPGSVCPSGASTVSIDLPGVGPWNFTYSDGVTPVTLNNIATSPYTFVVNPLVTTTYSITALSNSNCTATAADLTTANVMVSVNPSAVSTWLGASSDWTDPSNWCGGVPTSTKDVIIPTTANNPAIAVTTAVCHDINVSSGASLIINAGSIFSFKGAFVNNGAIVNNGTIALTGTSAQSFPGGTTGTITAMNILEVNNAAGATFNKSFTIWGTLKPTAGFIILSNDTVTLHSDTTSTARVSALGISAGFTYNGTGKFTVERFISSASRTSWRLLSAPIGGLQTINQAWQEAEAPGVYTSTGYGMQIVGPIAAGLGFDLNNTFPSVKKYVTATNTWLTIPGTTGQISSPDGYMAFIRGDRGSNTFGAKSTTTLRMSGPINTGNMPTVSTATPNSFICVGNPYPSAIDFTATTRNGLQNTYYLWDPKLGTYGGYQTFTGPGYTATPGLGSYGGGNKFIESGQAFFVVATAAVTAHDISFSETSKVAGSYETQRLDGQEKQISTRLYSGSGSNSQLIDGTLAEFDASYSNSLDDLDAPKLTNFGENIGIFNSSKIISVERRAEIINTDTLFYQLGQLKQQGYQLEFTTKNLANPGLSAWLEDNYLNTKKVIDLNAISVIDFIVDANSLSGASDRFRLVFRQLGPVPVTFTSIAAWRQEKNIMVKWKVENELNIDHYEVERSSEGRSFTKIGLQPARGNNGGTAQEYYLLDVQPFAGDNFYRIKSVGVGSDIKYSEVVKVNVAGDPSMIAVYPNPVKNGFIGISFTDQPKGYYDIKLFGTNGQLVLSQGINHPGGSQRIKFPIGSNFAQGVYNLEIILPAKKKRIFKVVIE